MKYKLLAIPVPFEGITITEPPLVVPDQSLTLKEILTRFVRHEALPVAHAGTYGSDIQDPDSDSPLNVDLEKLRFADLTEKDDFKAETEKVKKAYEKAEKEKADAAAKADAEKAEKDFQTRVASEVEKRAKAGPSI